MTGENYKKFLRRIKKEVPELIAKTQKSLNTSRSKGEDYYILLKFWEKLMDKAADEWKSSDYDELFHDGSAMMPMPAGVSKQMSNMLFEVRKLDLLFDLPLSFGLSTYSTDDWEGMKKKEVVEYFNETLFDFDDDDE